MAQTIKVTVREVYGNQTVYPACPTSEIFARIAGTKTRTHETLRLIEALGYTVENENPQILRRA